MQVFKIEPTVPYTGGVCLVAAKDTEEAIKVFCDKGYGEYEYDKYKCTCNITVGLNYDTKTPCIILDTLCRF